MRFSRMIVWLLPWGLIVLGGGRGRRVSISVDGAIRHECPPFDSIQHESSSQGRSRKGEDARVISPRLAGQWCFDIGGGREPMRECGRPYGYGYKVRAT